MSKAAEQVCDGRGGERVAAYLSRTADPCPRSDRRAVAMRRATAADARLLWEWRNDPISRRNSTSTEPIPFEDHVKWLQPRLFSPDSIVLIGELAASNIGTVRFDASDGGIWSVSITVAGSQRNRGLGGRLLSAACRYARVNGISGPLLGRIRNENAASQRIFERAGFVLAADSTEWLVYRLAAGVWPT